MTSTQASGWLAAGAAALALLLAPSAPAFGQSPDVPPASSAPQPDSAPQAEAPPALPAPPVVPPIPSVDAPVPPASEPEPVAPPAPSPTQQPEQSLEDSTPAPAAESRTEPRSEAPKERRAARRTWARARANAGDALRAARRRAEREDAALVSAPAHADVVPVAAVLGPPDGGPDTALVGAALGLCLVGFAAAGMVRRVGREAGLT